ncbi:hypothetical protein GVAV_000315 [Gurleya vavrai]
MIKSMRCTNNKCRKTEKVLKSKTINDSHLKTFETIKIIQMVLENASNKQIKNEIGVIRSTIYKIRKNLKTEIRKMFWKKENKIGGEMVLGADESKFGKKNNIAVTGLNKFGLSALLKEALIKKFYFL